MSTRVLTRKEADSLGLVPAKAIEAAAARRTNPHIEEILQEIRRTKRGQFAVYTPEDGKGYQTQVARIRQAFDQVNKPWPLTRPLDGGKATVMKILSIGESLEQYPQQPLAKKRSQEAAAPAPKPAAAPRAPKAKPAAKPAPRGKAKPKARAKASRTK